jgi:hypothetical protein
MTNNLLTEADEIYNDYKNRSRRFATPFNDAVIAFLYLFARWLLAAKTTNKK